MNRYFGYSLVLHLAVALSFLVHSKKVPETPTEIKIIDIPDKIKFNKNTVPHRDSPNSGYSIDKEIAKAIDEFNESNPLKKKEFIYSNYFERIRQKIRPRWVNAVWGYFKNKKISRTQTTAVLVILDKEGHVIDTVLVVSCGDSGLDSIALDSAKGEFFPNPPKELIEKDGFGRIVWTYNVNP